MTFKHLKFDESSTMRSLERVAREKGWVKTEDQLVKSALKKQDDFTPSANLTENILKLCSGLRQSGLSKYADELELKFIQYKKANSLYQTSKETGEDLVDAAHPDGSHKLEGVGGDSTFETIVDQHLINLKIVNKTPTGKLASSNDVLGAVKMALGAPPVFTGELGGAPGAPSWPPVPQSLPPAAPTVAGEGSSLGIKFLARGPFVSAGAAGVVITSAVVIGALVVYNSYRKMTRSDLVGALNAFAGEIADVVSDTDAASVRDAMNKIIDINKSNLLKTYFDNVSNTKTPEDAYNALVNLDGLLVNIQGYTGQIVNRARTLVESQILGIVRDWGDIALYGENVFKLVGLERSALANAVSTAVAQRNPKNPTPSTAPVAVDDLSKKATFLKETLIAYKSTPRLNKKPDWTAWINNQITEVNDLISKISTFPPSQKDFLNAELKRLESETSNFYTSRA